MKEIEKPKVVYNIHVKQNHNYFANGVLAKNCHLSTGASISKLVKMMSHIPFKYGLSGSLRDGKSNLLTYVGMFGEIFKPVSTKQLMEEGQVTDLAIKCLFLRYKEEDTLKCKGLDYQAEIAYITGHKRRNTWICKLAKKLADKDENVFVMFRHTKHGKAMYEALKTIHSNVHYVSGEVKTTERDTLKKMAESEKGMIVVASYGVFSTGISIKNLHHVIFAHPVKSKVTVLQSIGRVLRKHDSKDIATLWDIVDHLAVATKSPKAKKKFSTVNYALKHGLERVKRYAEEKFNYTNKTIEI